jgi:hypothetical protein
MVTLLFEWNVLFFRLFFWLGLALANSHAIAWIGILSISGNNIAGQPVEIKPF